jgi:hypothetical protein
MRIVIRYDTRVVVYSKTQQLYSTTQQRGKGVATEERERESTLTVTHIYHRICFPIGQVLIERSCVTKHCKREGATKKRKTNPPQHTTNKKVPFQTHKTKRTTRVRIVIIRNTKLELSYFCKIHHHNGRRRRGRREGQRVHLLLYIVVTADTSQAPITPYGFPVASFEAAKVGQDPSGVSLKQLAMAFFNGPFQELPSAGVNTA